MIIQNIVCVLLLFVFLVVGQLGEDDIVSDTRFKITINTNKIAQSEVNNNLQLNNSSQIIMRSSYGQPFLCTIPDVEVELERQDKLRDKQLKEKTAEDTAKMIERGLELLEPLGKTCMQFYANSHQYWLYEYCHKQYVRQFHVDRIYDGKEEKEQETASFYLGVYPTYSIDPTNNKAILQTTGQNSLQPITYIKEVDNQYYLVQKWEDGTLCDLTDRPRSVEIQYQCDAQGYDRVSSFMEVATCQYQAIISTPRLCGEMGLSHRHQRESHRIECQPIVSDEDMAVEQIELNRIEQEVESAEQEVAVKEEPNERREDVLLGMITQLTEQISQIKYQLKNTPKDAKTKTELSFYMLDEDGHLVTPANDINKLLGLTIQQQQLKEQQKKTQTEEQKEQSKDQHKNREAYHQYYRI